MPQFDTGFVFNNLGDILYNLRECDVEFRNAVI